MEDNKNKRSFSGPDGSTYYINPPTAEDIRGADWQYSKTFTKCLVEGITTSAEMIDILTRRGVIGPEYQQRADELSRILSEKVFILNNTTDLDVKRDLAYEVAMARENLFQWNQRLNGPMNNTCEQMSDNARLEYLTSCMVVDENNKRLWNSHDEFLSEKSQGIAMRAQYETMLYIQGLDSDFLDKTPEARAIKEIENALADKAREVLETLEAVESVETEKPDTEVKDESKVSKKKAPKKGAAKKN